MPEIIDPIEEPIGETPPGSYSPLEVPHQCLWCDSELVGTSGCIPCGGHTGKCRVPRWGQVSVAITNSLRSQWTVAGPMGNTKTCCGAAQFSLPLLEGFGPYYQWGYWKHYRNRRLETWNVSQQDRITGAAYTPVDKWTYTTFLTISKALVWFYHFTLNQYRVTVHPIIVGGVCKVRVAFTIYGTHFVETRILNQLNDGRPNTGCHIETVNGLTGWESASFNVPTPCDPTDFGTSCFGIGPWFSGVNPNAGMMPWIAEDTLTPGVGTSHIFAKSFCKDFDYLPSDVLSIASFTDSCGTKCSIPSYGSDEPPTLTSPVSWSSSDTTVTNTCPAFPTDTLGASPYSDCTPITPTPPPGSGFNRAYRHCQTSYRFVEEAMDGSAPDPVIAPLDLGTWTIQFSRL